ncbi:hypothetical protein U5A82_07425 [Sphingobium sp. CR2-8]|uniref:hypothetical protein n=1 Tax=Sphingobium sp. CR2-8 TaxID=1306534 RepID=UPI002DBB58FA|nr:hypothetical protein [Sphingobium sp. CR2-8]MEC3910319.1 hypothetical protein [Sphingobium sp. CR2-8]
MHTLFRHSISPSSIEDFINPADGKLYDALLESVREDIRVIGQKVELLKLLSGESRR